MCGFKNCSHLCAYHCAQLFCTTQQRTVLIIFTLNHTQQNFKNYIVILMRKRWTYSSQEWKDRCSKQAHPSHQTLPVDY